MRSLRKRTAAAAVVVGLMLTGASLSACGNAVENAVENAAGDAIGGDVDIEDGNISVTQSDGTELQIGENAEIPASWPSVIPVFDGDLMSVTSSPDGASVSAVWYTDQSPVDAIASYDALMTAAGYAPADNPITDIASARYVGDGYSVSTLAIEGHGPTTFTLAGEKES